MRAMKKRDAQLTFNNSKIIMCKRNAIGQVYAARGFRDMVHFTIGETGKKQLSTFFENNSINFYELRGNEKDMPAPDWFHVESMPNKSEETPSTFITTMQMKMKKLGKAFIPHLMKVRVVVPNQMSIHPQD